MAKQPLGIELVKKGVVTGKDIEQALEYQATHRNSSRTFGRKRYTFEL